MTLCLHSSFRNFIFSNASNPPLPSAFFRYQTTRNLYSPLLIKPTQKLNLDSQPRKIVAINLSQIALVSSLGHLAGLAGIIGKFR
jgi:hypothetical protein